MSTHTAWDLGQGTRTELEPSWHLPKELLLELSGEVGARLPGGGYAFVADQLVQAVACDLQHILLIVRWSASAGFLTFWVSYFYSNLSENTTWGLFKQNKNFPNQHNARKYSEMQVEYPTHAVVATTCWGDHHKCCLAGATLRPDNKQTRDKQITEDILLDFLYPPSLRDLNISGANFYITWLFHH